MAFKLYQPEFDTQEEARAACDEVLEARTPEVARIAVIMALPNGKFSYVYCPKYPTARIETLNAGVVEVYYPFGQQD